MLAIVALAAAAPLAAPADQSSRPASQPASRPASAPATKTLKVATFNVLYLNRDLKAVAQTIRDGGADVVCLQETNPASAAFLRRQLGKLYPHTRFRHARGAGGLGILSKVRVGGLKYLPRRFGHFGSYLFRVEFAGSRVQIANVHLVSTNPAGGRGRKLLAHWRLTEAVRAKEIAYVVENLPADRPVIIAGDLNSMPAWSAPRFLAGKGYVDSLAAARKDHAELTTWSGLPFKLPLAARLDYVFHTKHLRCLAARVLPCKGSDHSLVVCTVAPAAKPAGAPASRPAASSRPPSGR